MKTILLIFIFSTITVVSQLILKKGSMGLAVDLTNPILLAKEAFTSPYVLVSIALMGMNFLLWVVVLSRVNLGYAIGFAGAFFYLILPLLSWWLYGERLSPIQWGGLLLITLGILCLQAKGG
jgi:multidrug transporter EmrE-like cation transporter